MNITLLQSLSYRKLKEENTSGIQLERLTGVLFRWSQNTASCALFKVFRCFSEFQIGNVLE